MVKQINRDKVKIKHLLNVKGENYPTEEDFLYEVVSELQDLDMLNSEFTTKDIAKNVTARIVKTDSPLADSLLLLKDKGFCSMVEAPKRNLFRLISHPWE